MNKITVRDADLADAPIVYEFINELEVCCNVRRTKAHRFYIANGFQQTHYKFTQVHPVDH